MHNFEARYRAIVEKQSDLKRQDIDCSYYPKSNKYCWGQSGHWIPTDIARAAVCWWLAGKLPERYRYCTHNNGAMVQKWKRDDGDEWEVFTSSTDPADAIMTAWEIILGIKEKA